MFVGVDIGGVSRPWTRLDVLVQSAFEAFLAEAGTAAQYDVSRLLLPPCHLSTVLAWHCSVGETLY